VPEFTRFGAHRGFRHRFGQAQRRHGNHLGVQPNGGAEQRPESRSDGGSRFNGHAISGAHSGAKKVVHDRRGGLFLLTRG